jgi:hypothetical protein
MISVNDRPVLSLEMAPHIDKNGDCLDSITNLVLGPQMGLDTKTG